MGNGCKEDMSPAQTRLNGVWVLPSGADYLI